MIYDLMEQPPLQTDPPGQQCIISMIPVYLNITGEPRRTAAPASCTPELAWLPRYDELRRKARQPNIFVESIRLPSP